MSKYVAVSTAATQQGHQGKHKKGMPGQTLRRSSLRPHAMVLPIGKVWYVGVPITCLTEIFLAPLEKILPEEKQAKQNPQTTV